MLAVIFRESGGRDVPRKCRLLSHSRPWLRCHSRGVYSASGPADENADGLETAMIAMASDTSAAPCWPGRLEAGDCERRKRSLQVSRFDGGHSNAIRC
jgi:hypothetical protein